MNAPTNGASVMNGCAAAWSGVQRSVGSARRHPSSRSSSAARSCLVASADAVPASFVFEDDDPPPCAMMSRSSVCLKYFFPTAARFLESCSYSSSVLSRYEETPPPGCIAAEIPPVSAPPVSLLKNFLALLALSSMDAGGGPSVSHMRVIRLYSEAPGNSGRPRNSSAITHPRLHMSMGMP